jgi:hypothetical protein
MFAPLPQTASLVTFHRKVRGYVPTSCLGSWVSVPVSQNNIFSAFYVREKVRKLVAAEENLHFHWSVYLSVFNCDYIFVLLCPYCTSKYDMI